MIYRLHCVRCVLIDCICFSNFFFGAVIDGCSFGGVDHRENTLFTILSLNIYNVHLVVLADSVYGNW